MRRLTIADYLAEPKPLVTSSMLLSAKQQALIYHGQTNVRACGSCRPLTRR